jgi:hypothetical protein
MSYLNIGFFFDIYIIKGKPHQRNINFYEQACIFRQFFCHYWNNDFREDEILFRKH